MRPNRYVSLFVSRLAVFIIAIFVFGLGTEAGAVVIKDIEIKGARALEEETVMSFIESREGAEYSADQVTKDIRALYA